MEVRKGFTQMYKVNEYRVLRNDSMGGYVVERLGRHNQGLKWQPKALWDRSFDTPEEGLAAINEFLKRRV